MAQPDISILCDRDELDEYSCKGAPHLALAIRSPSHAHHDFDAARGSILDGCFIALSKVFSQI